MQTLRALALFLFLAALAGCSYEPYADLTCSSDQECAVGASCVEGLCVFGTEPDAGPGAPARIDIDPTELLLSPGETANLQASVLDSEGQVVPDAMVIWTSDTETVATVEDGLVTAVADGQTTIVASIGDLSATATVAVETPVASVVISPDPVDLGVGTSEQLSATVLDAGGNELIGRDVIWLSRDPAVATVDQNGLATGVAEGETEITATASDVTGTAAVTVSATTPTTIEITPQEGMIPVGQTTRYEAVIRDITGRVIDASIFGAAFEWDVEGTAFDDRGSVPGTQFWRLNYTPRLGDETTTTSLTVTLELEATANLVSDPLTISPFLPSIETLTTVPANAASLDVGETLMATYMAIDETGNVDTVQPATWTSSEESVATVAPDGTITAVGPGTTTITVEVGGATATIDVTVTFVLDGVAAGVAHSCGVTPQNLVYCWGDNGAGQIGDNSIVSRELPARVVTQESFLSVVAGDEVSCGLTMAGNAFCWGDDARLGDDASTGDSSTPVAVATTETFTQLAGSYGHVCGLSTTGEIYCWGDGNMGQIGNGSNMSVDVPTQVVKPTGVMGWKLVAVGHSHTCAVDLTDQLYCWGKNNESRLGTGGTMNSDDPVEAMTTENFTLLSLGEKTSCGLVGTTPYCWGDDAEGQTGTGQGSIVSTPTMVPGTSLSDLSMGDAHVCGIDAATTDVYCWGKSGGGRLGTGQTSDSSTPTPVVPTLKAVDIALGSDFSCAVDDTNEPYCWGVGAAGRIGGGDATDSDAPRLVWPAP